MGTRNRRSQSLIYHLTELNNIESILENGLIPRALLSPSNFIDVADQQILSCRGEFGLDNFVPFHFFVRNPFDEGVQKNSINLGKHFAIIAVTREYARSAGFKIVPTHPRSMSPFKLYDYDEGFDAIDWDLMNQQNYFDHNCKMTCMAECLSPTIVPSTIFHSIVVKDKDAKIQVVEILEHIGINLHVNVNLLFFF